VVSVMNFTRCSFVYDKDQLIHFSGSLINSIIRGCTVNVDDGVGIRSYERSAVTVPEFVTLTI
jgi:hypothetical protein